MWAFPRFQIFENNILHMDGSRQFGPLSTSLEILKAQLRARDSNCQELELMFVAVKAKHLDCNLGSSWGS